MSDFWFSTVKFCGFVMVAFIFLRGSFIAQRLRGGRSWTELNHLPPDHFDENYRKEARRFYRYMFGGIIALATLIAFSQLAAR